ncbi:MAG: hypothetical protein PQJ46_06180 [Spirochaetales bacterium]|nr:hypothetical protein [Spirochaetales bacterium]
MGETVRFGVSMDSGLVELLDRLSHQHGDENRSETIRNLVRQEVINTSSNDDKREVIATLTLMYNYETKVPRVSIKPYPSVKITANMQMHAEDEICVKILVVKGLACEVRAWAQKLLSNKKIISNLTINATDELYKELL